jgi:asparagine synthase (glutamine-hydrolysing)
VLGQPVSLTSNIVWVQDMMDAAGTDVQVLLTGQYGNSTISWYGLPRLSLVRRARVSGVRGAAHHLQPVWLERARVRRDHEGGRWPGTPITPELAERTDLAARMADAIGRGRPSVRATSREHRVAGTQPGASTTGGLWNVLGASVGVDVRDPTADPRVIEFAWSVPDRFFRDDAGRSRVVLRTALTGLVPEEVRTNASLGRQAADVGLRLSHYRDEVEAAIGEIAAGPAAEYVSVPALRSAWTRVQGPPDPSVSRVTSSVLLAGLMTGWWVNDLDRG